MANADDLISAILQGPGDISAKFFGSGGFAPTGREGGETALDAFSRLFGPTAGQTKPAAAGPAAGPADGGSDLLSALRNILSGGGGASIFQAGPIAFERGTGPGGAFSPGTRARTITGGFAPGTIGATIQAMLPKILASLTGGAAGGPTREDLLAPRLGDIESRERTAQQAILNRFASLGRSAAGTTTTENLGELTRQAGVARQGAFGDVDRILAEIANARQGNLLSLLKTFLSGVA